MSIRKSGYPNITPDDLQWTHRGRTMGVELTNTEGMQFAMVVELVDGKWNIPIGGLLETCMDQDIINAGGAVGWIKTVFLPWLNNILLQTFPPVNQDVSQLLPFEQVDAILTKTVAIASQPDGTLKASMR